MPEEVSQKKKILDIFNKNVRGKKPQVANYNSCHDGKEGHWLELQMGISHNADNEPDLFGYEMKNHTTSKTTFGDWSANYYIFEHGNPYSLDRDKFLKYFGKPNNLKSGRHSWSGEPCPKISSFNSFGQKLLVDGEDNILAIYSFSKDQRINKASLIPASLQLENLILAKWDRNSIAKKLERKFNQLGWFKCKKDSTGIYTSIVFGKPISYKNWIELVKKGVVFFDSGMYQGNSRPYSQWRANNSVWESLIDERF